MQCVLKSTVCHHLWFSIFSLQTTCSFFFELQTSYYTVARISKTTTTTTTASPVSTSHATSFIFGRSRSPPTPPPPFPHSPPVRFSSLSWSPPSSSESPIERCAFTATTCPLLSPCRCIETFTLYDSDQKKKKKNYNNNNNKAKKKNTRRYSSPSSSSSFLHVTGCRDPLSFSSWSLKSVPRPLRWSVSGELVVRKRDTLRRLQAPITCSLAASSLLFSPISSSSVSTALQLNRDNSRKSRLISHRQSEPKEESPNYEMAQQNSLNTDEHWKDKLTAQEYAVLRQKHTEPPFKGEYDSFYPSEGHFSCRACKRPLFPATAKFKSGCGWPSFDKFFEGSILTLVDRSLGQTRTEILCARCGGHLGHVFVGERMTIANERHCVNSLSIKYVSHLPKAEESFKQVNLPATQ